MEDQGDLPFSLVPIKKVDVFRSVMHQLDLMISNLGPGDRLGAERELAQMLDVSRVTVREALRVFEGMGRIEIRRNAGSYVTGTRTDGVPVRTEVPPQVDFALVRNVAEVRAALECQIIRLVAAKENVDFQPLLRSLDEVSKQLKSPGHDEGSLDLHFEAYLGRASGNPLLAQYQQAIHRTWIDVWLQLGGAVGERERLHREHLQILAALEEGDGPLAVRLMAEHVDPHSH